jgi:hypothetical protein
MIGGEGFRARQVEWLENPRSNIAGGEDGFGGYHFVPNQLLVAQEQQEQLAESLEKLGVAAERFDDQRELGLVLVTLPPSQEGVQDVPGVLATLSDPTFRLATPEPLRVTPHHVLRGEPDYQGGTASLAEPAPAQEMTLGGAGGGPRVAVVDTGYTRDVHTEQDKQVDSSGTNPPLDAQPADGEIDFEAGHGTFVTGIVLRQAPTATVEVVEVLGPAGFCTELDVANAILSLRDVDVINLSLGAYTRGNEPPAAIEAALARLSPRTAVVAAAGNAGRTRQMWPAAFKRVVAVGALDDDGNRASFSNYGSWVDTYVPGVGVVSTFPRWPDDGSVFDGWAIWSGTSFAAPKVAGHVAAATAIGPYESPREAAIALVTDVSLPRIGGFGTVLEI